MAENLRNVCHRRSANDYAFKSVFGSQRHARVLLHLLNAVLVPYGLRIHSAQILNPLSEIQNLNDKKLILDVKAADEHGRLYNIEMQMVPAPSFPGRLLYYWSNSYGSQLKEGDDYGLLRPVISICFLDGFLFPGRDECHLRFRLLEATAHFPFTEDLDLHLFQLPQFTKLPDELGSDLDLWLYVLNNGRGLDLASLPANSGWRKWKRRWRHGPCSRKTEYSARSTKPARSDDGMRRTRAWPWSVRKSKHGKGSREPTRRATPEGHAVGVWLGHIRAYEEVLQALPRPDAELSLLSADELRQIAEDLRRELSGPRRDGDGLFQTGAISDSWDNYSRSK